MGRTVSIARAKARLSHWIRQAEAGEPVVITRPGTRHLRHFARVPDLRIEPVLAESRSGRPG